jgi:hypothetical protein
VKRGLGPKPSSDCPAAPLANPDSSGPDRSRCAPAPRHVMSRAVRHPPIAPNIHSALPSWSPRSVRSMRSSGTLSPAMMQLSVNTAIAVHPQSGRPHCHRGVPDTTRLVLVSPPPASRLAQAFSQAPTPSALAPTRRSPTAARPPGPPALGRGVVQVVLAGAVRLRSTPCSPRTIPMSREPDRRRLRAKSVPVLSPPTGSSEAGRQCPLMPNWRRRYQPSDAR